MMLAILAEAALRVLVLGTLVWLGLHLLRIHNPNAHMTAWVMVLIASLSMPLLMHWTTVTITVHSLPAPAPEILPPAETLPADSLRAAPSPEQGAFAAARGVAINWWTVATILYALGAGLLLTRLLLGLHLTWRLARAARPLRERRLGRPRQLRDHWPGDGRVDHPRAAGSCRVGPDQAPSRTGP